MSGYFDAVKARLNSLGIRVDNDAAILINMCIERAEGTIKHTCNLSAVPAGLETILVDMAVGEFLLTQKTFGKLNGIDIDAEAVKQVQMGDTNVSYSTDSTKSPEQRIDALISHFTRDRKKELLKYRRMVW